MKWDKISIFRTNRVIPRVARAYCREDFREDVARKNINKMASKITSASEVNTDFLSSVSIPNFSLSTSLNVAMKVRMIQVIWISAVVFFRTNPVAKTR